MDTIGNDGMQAAAEALLRWRRDGLGRAAGEVTTVTVELDGASGGIGVFVDYVDADGLGAQSDISAWLP